MKIGKSTVPRTAICTSDEHTIVVRGQDLCQELIGHLSFSDYFFLLLTGRRPDAACSAVLDATLVAIAEHGLVPSVQASRMTFAAAPDALQGAVAAGILGCGSVILGASETAGRLFMDVAARMDAGATLQQAAAAAIAELKVARAAIPGYGHPLHKERDPRVDRLIDVATQAGADLRYVRIAQALEEAIPGIVGKDLRMNVSAAIPAVLLGVGFPVASLRGVPILARTAGLIAHLAEEAEMPSGFALSYQATRELQYEGTVPAAFGEAR
ncbi:citrate synthase [Variovorax paradoxus]|uniref:citrate synthase (unknown stereospecificity) n=1 Tax=Variovorax paradoxus TaxID=34073 RepID=A0AAE3Y098_VARPD|nr:MULTISPECIES: citryl-CoA lyase [Variovorax]MBD9667828.1 citryl-CoA lyase [Variovorax sp. VRV01]MDP9964389.1 citrate synthase [Variovorax paradoxus]MDR6427317.1 citrate synthase [Variovorax paradoxus]MDR6454478.1 citrate synthase [Variovorax paradoxus]